MLDYFFQLPPRAQEVVITLYDCLEKCRHEHRRTIDYGSHVILFDRYSCQLIDTCTIPHFHVIYRREDSNLYYYVDKGLVVRKHDITEKDETVTVELEVVMEV